jgi:hypothetical protein
MAAMGHPATSLLAHLREAWGSYIQENNRRDTSLYKGSQGTRLQAQGVQSMKSGNLTIRRLRKCVQILRKIKNPTERLPDFMPRFSMRAYSHECGSPACAYGWYAADKWKKEGKNVGDLVTTHNRWEEFPGLSDAENDGLFSAYGCNEAKTPEAAACYIERFIERKLLEG